MYTCSWRLGLLNSFLLYQHWLVCWNVRITVVTLLLMIESEQEITINSEVESRSNCALNIHAPQFFQLKSFNIERLKVFCFVSTCDIAHNWNGHLESKTYRYSHSKIVKIVQ